MKSIANWPRKEKETLFRNTAGKCGLSVGIVEKDFGYVGHWINCSMILHGKIILHLREEQVFPNVIKV